MAVKLVRVKKARREVNQLNKSIAHLPSSYVPGKGKLNRERERERDGEEKVVGFA